MMHEIHISKLSEIKSVFNSYADNEQYYKVLKKSGLNIIDSVELAQPLSRNSNLTIIWKAKTVQKAIAFNSLIESDKKIVSQELENFFTKFKAKTDQFRNISSDFANKVIQIPDVGSIFFDPNNKKIVIVNWGFLEDSFNRKEGVINTLFPRQSNSILIKVIDQDNKAVSNLEMELSTDDKRIIKRTNNNGYANFNHLPKGKEFNISLINHTTSSELFNFICDGRSEYILKIQIDANSLEIEEEQPVSFDEEFEKELNLDKLEQNIDINEDVTIQFVNFFNRPIKSLNVSIFDGNKYQYETNRNGEINFTSSSTLLEASCVHKKNEWTSEINLINSRYHIVKLKPKYPWLWWLLILFLSFLLVCCLFFNCFCSSKEESIVQEKEETKANSLPCNSENKSGGEGITLNIHNLGDQIGTVYINYDMQNVPDKIEVFYQNELVASTYDVQGNKDGYVGGAAGTSCCGTISFNYVKDRDDFCKIVVSGNDQTAWAYSISCPE